MYFAEHALAAFRPGEVAGCCQREVHERRRGRCLAEPAETARRPHLGGDEVGHLVQVAGVDRGQLFDLGHPIGVGHSRPRAVVESVSCGGDGGFDVLGPRHLHVADGLFGKWRNDLEPLRISGFAPLPSDEQFVIRAMAGIFCHRGTS